MNKTGVPKEAQDDALSNGTTGGRQTPTGRPTRGDVVRMTVFCLCLGVVGGFEFPFFGDALCEKILLATTVESKRADRRQSFLANDGNVNYKKQHTNKWRASIPQICPEICVSIFPKFQFPKSIEICVSIFPKFQFPKSMKTASLGLLEVLGGDLWTPHSIPR